MLFVVGFMLGSFVPGSLLDHYWLDGEKMKSHERLVRIYDEVDWGDGYDSVAKKVVANITVESVRVSYDGAKATWEVISPAFDFLGYERKLFLCFADGQLEGAYFRTTDSSVKSTPHGAPLPKGKMCQRHKSSIWS